MAARRSDTKAFTLDDNEAVVPVPSVRTQGLTRLETNAPPEWPVVLVAPASRVETAAEYSARVSMAVAARLEAAGVRVIEFSREVRAEGRVLVVDLVVTDGPGREIPVFVLQGLDPAGDARYLADAARHLAAARRHGGMPTYWYAPVAPHA